MGNNETNNGKKGGLLKGKPHYDKNGKSLGGIKAIVTDTNTPVELEGGEVIINKHASKKYWKELSKINQSAGNGVPIKNPNGNFDEDPEEYKDGGNVIQFNANHTPSKIILNYAKKIKSDYPKVWDKGGNIFGNEAFKNLQRVSERGYWLDTEKWMYVKWRSYVARHKQDFRINGVVAMLKWVDKVDKGWSYMKDLIESEIEKKYPKKATKMVKGGIAGDVYSIKNVEQFKQIMTTFNELSEQFGVENYFLDPNDNCVVFLVPKSAPKINIIKLRLYVDGLIIRGFNIFDTKQNIVIKNDNSEGGNYLYFKLNLSESIEYAKGGNVVTYKNKFNKKYGFSLDESHSLKDIAKITNLKLSSLQDIFDKGIGAYKTNPESVRPNVKSKEQWAMARVYSSIMGGKAAKVDATELKEAKMEHGGTTDKTMEKAKKYNSYEDFVKDNIGSKKIVVRYGSGGQSQPLDGATKESIEKQFKGMIYHAFLDSEFYYNYTSSNKIADEYKSFVREFYNSLLESPKEFADFWKNNMAESGSYNALYELKDNLKNIETNYDFITGNKRVDSKSKYVLAIKNQAGQIIKYVPTELPESHDLFIFSKYKNKMSNELKKEYIDYKKRYAGEDIKFKNGGNLEKNIINSDYSNNDEVSKENMEMVVNQNKQILHHTEELKKAIDSGAQVPAWVVAKINRAANDMSDATHYLDGTLRYAFGGNIQSGQVYDWAKYGVENTIYVTEIKDEMVFYKLNGVNKVRGMKEFVKFLEDNNLRAGFEFKHGGEIPKGIKEEEEHKAVLNELYERKITPEQSLEIIAKDHITKDPKYYSKLEKYGLQNGGALVNPKDKVDYDLKSDVFVNTDIFTSEMDYIIGGFMVDELNKIRVVGNNSAINMAKLDEIFTKRLEFAVEDLKKSIVKFDSDGFADTDDADEDIGNEINNMFETYLGISFNSINTDEIVEKIKSDSSYLTWITRIESRINLFKSRLAYNVNDVMLNESNKMSIKEIEYLTKNSTLEEIFEKLHQINEQNTI